MCRYIIHIPHQTLHGWWNHSRWDELGIWHVWGSSDIHTRVGSLIVATIYLNWYKIDTCFEVLLSFNVVTSIARCQRCGSRRIPLAAPVVLIVRMERSTAWRSHKGLSPCDYDLIPKMKKPLRGIRFRTVPEILQVTTVKDSKTSKHVSILYQL